jgi:tRNA(Ile)-lysidine synthase
MSRSHPPTLITHVRRSLREECAVGRGDRLLVAVSGGGDSLALLHALTCVAPRLGLVLHAHGVDHGLRPEAAAELELARELADRCRVPFSTSTVRVGAGANLQARARDARYRALRAAAAGVGAGYLATGHHADDRAETVLLRLLRGAGPAGLAVLPPRAGDLLRPMIRARKADVLAHLGRHAIRYAEDPSNQDRRFLRVRVRHELLPLLAELSPAVVSHLCALADQIGTEPLPRLADAAGHPVLLGRAQAGQLQRARALGLAGVRVRLPGGREAALDPATGQISLVDAARGPGDCRERRRG